MKRGSIASLVTTTNELGFRSDCAQALHVCVGRFFNIASQIIWQYQDTHTLYCKFEPELCNLISDHLRDQTLLCCMISYHIIREALRLQKSVIVGWTASVSTNTRNGTRMVVEVYGMALSAPCRMVYMTCEALGVDYERINVDLFKGEHMVRRGLIRQMIFETVNKSFSSF